MPTVGGRGGRSPLAWVGAALIALLAIHAVRAAFVVAEGDRAPETARQLWPWHPIPLQTLALREIGLAARQGEAPPQSALRLLARSALADPLSPQPLLVAATERLAAGQAKQGRQLLEVALERDPRSAAAQFLLADLAIRGGRLGDAFTQIGALERRMGPRTAAFAGAVATYVRQPGASERVAPVLARNPSLRTAVLTQLAADPAAAATLRRLVLPADASAPWLALAVERRLVEGDVAEARALLAAAGAADSGSRLSAWSAGARSRPLRWRFAGNGEGLAELGQGGSLRLIHYGRAEAVLAEHFLILSPDRYRLDWLFAGVLPPDTLEWVIVCPGTSEPARILPAGPQPAGTAAVDIARNCASQRLQLRGRISDFPRTTSVELVRVGLSRDPQGSR